MKRLLLRNVNCKDKLRRKKSRIGGRASNPSLMATIKARRRFGRVTGGSDADEDGAGDARRASLSKRPDSEQAHGFGVLYIPQRRHGCEQPPIPPLKSFSLYSNLNSFPIISKHDSSCPSVQAICYYPNLVETMVAYVRILFHNH